MLEESLGNSEAVCGSALLNAVTCLASSKLFINFTSPIIHCVRSYFVLSFVFLVKGPIQIFLVHRIEISTKATLQTFLCITWFWWSGRRSMVGEVRHDMWVDCRGKVLSFALLFVLIGTLCYSEKKNVLLHFNTWIKSYVWLFVRRSLLARNKLGATKVTHFQPLSIWMEFILWSKLLNSFWVGLCTSCTSFKVYFVG